MGNIADDLKGLKIPEHVAVIMDGNGRWAEAQGQPRTYGHAAGSEVVENMVEVMSDAGVRFLRYMHFPPKTGSAQRRR